ncbi:tRNA dihydrouridine(20/20a) synthase DusA [Carnimonas nigrificans]|uniref:tRNA dihydrouridine(20/20a) synthase DusA n=1 Tax=Carnimonas nigrificans TaxID=64323 RepID=UPI000471E221|nr:tRNA dihydrouridine(20/20a) synthase DusA [Carnimonas nigrificans]
MIDIKEESLTDRARRFSVAPMMDWTTRDYRAFARCLTREALLYTEMVTTGALLHGTPRERFVGHSEVEHPLALQLGGSDAGELAECAAIAQQWGFDEVNLNVGCPSDRVQNNEIGACLMAQPEKVARAIKTMQDAVSIPVTVKCRIGIDDQDTEADLDRFIDQVADEGGCRVFIVHARKAWLAGLSPKQNREVPPLDYARVRRLKARRPELHISLNGGLTTLADALPHLDTLDGVMLGRAAYHDPWLLASVDEQLFGSTAVVSSRLEALKAFRPYVEHRLAEGVKLNHITRHILGLCAGQHGGRAFRRYLSQHAHLPDAGIDVYDAALEWVTG